MSLDFHWKRAAAPFIGALRIAKKPQPALQRTLADQATGLRAIREPARLRACLIIAALMATTSTAVAQDFDTQATAAWVYDLRTDTVLLEKRSDEAVPPASMSKLMTLFMLFEALRDGRVSMDTPFIVSPRAQEIGGSTMFLNTADRPTVRELITGIVVNSGNDACIVVAEGLAGSEDAFAAQMTERGKAIGLRNSTFANATGWPDPRHRMSPEDIGLIAVRLIEDFPEQYELFSQLENDFEDRSPANRFNRNPLLRMGIGADGLKTGWTSEAGFGLVGSATDGDRRIVSVISGLPSEEARAREARNLHDWAFRSFTVRSFGKAGDVVAAAPVHLGQTDEVTLVLKDDVEALIPSSADEDLTAEAVFLQPLSAPVQAGQIAGDLIVRSGERELARAPLVVGHDVAEGGFKVRMQTAGRTLFDAARARVADE